MSDPDAPEGLMLAIANAHDDQFRWRCAAAAVEQAKVMAGDGVDGVVAARVIWRWTEAGEAFARYLAIGLGMSPSATDDQIREAILVSWDTVLAGMPSKE